MLTSIEGVYRDGHIELAEQPANVQNETRVIVTFLQHGQVALHARGIDPAHAADLRAQLAPFADEWNSPEINVYDDYDAAKASA